MTRWERMLEALGTDEREFELAHKAKFDASPSDWLKTQLAKLLEAGDDDDVIPAAACQAACCIEVG